MNPKDIYDITSNFNQPVVLKNIIKWKLLTWNLKDWCNILKEEKLVFRKIPFINSKVFLSLLFIFRSNISFYRNHCGKISANQFI